MHEMLQQLQGQSSALTLLLKAIDSSSIDQISTNDDIDLAQEN
jgi:hypothetical protein